jgi:hypothetical protein
MNFTGLLGEVGLMLTEKLYSPSALIVYFVGAASKKVRVVSAIG